MCVQYVGTKYAGWQVQPNEITIQGELQKAIKEGLKEDAEVFGSGRTDAGVHAFGQIAHFDTQTKINPDKIYAVINRFLPQDIRVLNTEQVDMSFHSRFDAVQKTYQYNFYCSEVNMPILDSTYAKVRIPFCYSCASKACEAFLGTHDFKGFCSSKTRQKGTVRKIYAIYLTQRVDDTYCLTVIGNGFLHNMVRIIAGTIIEVGCGQKKPEEIPNIIASGQRDRAGKTAQACGLVLKSVEYIEK